MNILLTGATGFVGSHLLKALLEKKNHVVILKRSFSDCSRISEQLQFCDYYDVDTVSVKKIFKQQRFDAVIHCATNYGREGKSLSEVIESNLNFPLELLDTTATCQCPCFINTDSCFTKQLPDRLLQSKPLYRPEYTLSKFQFREWGNMYSVEGKINFINLQMEHIYGPNDSHEKFIPFVVNSLKSNLPVLDLTDGIQVRDFIHVNDVVRAYLVVLDNFEKLHGYHNFEVGTGVPCTLREFVEKIHSALNSNTRLNFGALSLSDTEIMRSFAESKPLQDLGWCAVNREDTTWMFS